MIRITHELIGYTPSTQVDEMTVATDASYTTARDSTSADLDQRLPDDWPQEHFHRADPQSVSTISIS